MSTVGDSSKIYLVATVADGRMTNISPGIAKIFAHRRQLCVRRSSSEGMAWMMTVLGTSVALKAEIVVIAGGACDELVLGQD